jgi:hypothetical protein
MGADEDRRFGETLVRALHAARRKLCPYQMRPGQSVKGYERREREGLSAVAAINIAERIFLLADAAGATEVREAATELHIDARALFKRDRAEEREGQRQAAEQDKAFAENYRRREEERWAALEFCSTTEFHERFGRRRDLHGLLKKRGYLEGEVGVWRLSEKALADGVGKVEVLGPRRSIIRWRKNFVESLDREFEGAGDSI